MEIKFKQLLFTVQKRERLQIFGLKINYKRFPSSMLTIRSIIVVFVLFCWKTSKKFLLTLERKKNPDFDSYLKMLLKKLQLRSTRFNARAIIDSETESFTEEPIHEYFAQCRYLPFIALRAYALNK